MGVLKYTAMTFKRDLKSSIFYMLAMIISISAIFNIFNIIFNENIISRNSADYQTISIIGLIVQLVAIVFILFANSYYIEGNFKEYGVITTSGRSIFEIAKIVVLRNLISSIISVTAGCILGSLISPMINIKMYEMAGVTGDSKHISSLGVVMTCMIIAVQFMFVLLINTGSIYRKKVNELMKYESKPFIPDKREIKVNPIIYIIVFLSPVFMILLPINNKDKLSLLTFVVAASTFGIQGLVRYVVPNAIIKYKNKKLITSKTRLIWMSNLHHSLQKSTYLILTLILATSYTIIIACGYKTGTILNTSSLAAFVVVVGIMSFTVVYKFLVEALKRKENYKQLKLLGYTKSEISRIIFQEVVVYYFIIILISIPHMIIVILASIKAGVLVSSLGFTLILGYILTFAVTGVISYIGYRRIAL